MWTAMIYKKKTKFYLYPREKESSYSIYQHSNIHHFFNRYNLLKWKKHEVSSNETLFISLMKSVLTIEKSFQSIEM
jgi:hypothetical protein